MATAAELDMYEPISGPVDGEGTAKVWAAGAGVVAGVNMTPPPRQSSDPRAMKLSRGVEGRTR